MQSSDTQTQQAKESEQTLPDTGQTTSQSGLFAAVAAMFAGLGLLRKSKKDKEDDQQSSEQ
ncbi:LPXTG cell wall anchor domain-containing protein [Staphylococcus coagulans]|nr:LPXTG cell wall anchor domain-containing protein [Staphylococcus coagulans]MBA8764683.1 LPXTG cell wall anchor domain-containing protein [Staphylococcus coagulans]MBT2810139.1 LPXTG cell wall anchor domain-containing protein [Staphylococcus coagulans]MBT2821680.1 LPXTG cell wall anchor domain-containing protein [Staphylococcus coagulans]MBT2839985.1 LPXTG cell wall anchor domain-containing protein [Staphylococcus coagulans]MBT2844229.1 LPXTG cell wall anchor domain-containing protein [Staph